MLVEHTFVTTMEAEEALMRAQVFLERAGFGDAHGEPRSLRMRRGREAPLARTSYRDWPQEVRLDYDRGRVVVAASLHELKGVEPLHRDMVLALARGLEKLLAHEAEAGWAMAELDAVLVRVDEEFTTRRRKRRNAEIGCLLLVALLIGAIIYAAVEGSR